MPEWAHGASPFYQRTALERERFRAIILMTLTDLTLYKGIKERYIMKINVNIPMNSKRTRILASFMAFLIFALTFQQAFVGWDWGVRIKAVDITAVTKAGEFQRKYTVASTSHDGHSVVKASASAPTSEHTLNYRYTGVIKPAKVSFFDYKTDNEINGNPISNVYTDWGSEPFNQFNTKISDDVADSVTQ